MPTRPAEWREQAACAGAAGDLFFPTNYTTPQADRAREICHGCPVAATCLEDAMRFEGSRTADYRHGIRAGLDPSQRMSLYRSTRRDV